MRGFKDLIARRRPASEDNAGQAPDGSAQPEAMPDALPDPWEELQRTARDSETQPAITDPADIRAARDHVPRPPRPKPLLSRKWTPQDAHVLNRSGHVTPDPLSEEQVAAQALRDPGMGRRPPQTRMILADLEAVHDDMPESAPDVPADNGYPQNRDPQGGVPRGSEPAPSAAPISRPKVWDIDPKKPAAVMSRPQSTPAPGSALAQSAASAYGTDPGGAARPASTRAKTRLLGFHSEPTPDMLDTPPAAATTEAPRFPIGWLVVVDGPGRGASFTLTAGLSTVGRDADQTVSLDFGDTAISRERHLAIAYDADENRTYVGHGGKANIVKLNDKPLLTTEDLQDQDTLRIGKTLLRFVAFCRADFAWATGTEADNG